MTEHRKSTRLSSESFEGRATPGDAFDQELRAWASRPAQTPPREAAELLAKRLSEQAAAEAREEPRWGGLRLASAAALVLALVGGWWILGSKPGDPPLGEELPASVLQAEALHAEVTLDENVALIWLNAETPLYLTLTPPPVEKEPSS